MFHKTDVRKQRLLEKEYIYIYVKLGPFAESDRTLSINYILIFKKRDKREQS